MRKILGAILLLISIALLFTVIQHNVIFTWFSGNMKVKQASSMDNTQIVKINAGGANVRIIPEDREDLSADLQKNGTKNVKLAVERDGSQISVAIERPWFHWFNIFSFHKSMDLTIHIPINYHNNVDIDLSSGKLELYGTSKQKPLILKELEIDMSSGNADLQYLQVNHLETDMSSGNLQLRDITAKLSEFDLSSGNVTLLHYIGGLNADLSSGKFTAQIDKLNGPVNIEASSGNVALHLPKDADFTLDAKASSGNIRYDFPLHNVTTNKHDNIRGTYGTGKHKMNIRISSGNVHLY
ncbi:DUF4097 family beta strand repeat-containing protein [Bacillus sp. 165]|uniref:LiaG family protein n=1 Tax=Bacillus sp. 165 TaxID=1529117 RepID=UPI001ADA4265|nr:DUF4097 family beta strand repeat-containing protein [Bacillus sp. 165]MBO9129993.1 DUF4097 family beta strand repeat protein [Bacillus sp. 165]